MPAPPDTDTDKDHDMNRRNFFRTASLVAAIPAAAAVKVVAAEPAKFRSKLPRIESTYGVSPRYEALVRPIAPIQFGDPLQKVHNSINEMVARLNAMPTYEERLRDLQAVAARYEALRDLA